MSDWKATKRPSPLISGKPPLAMNRVELVCRSRTNTPLGAPGARLEELLDANATNRPSSLTEGSTLSPSAGSPALLTLTCSVVPLTRSRKKTSGQPRPGTDAKETTEMSGQSISPETRLDAFDSKTIKRPSPLTEGWELSLFA